MTSFALITEGITDQAVLENLLYGFYAEEPDINPIQPIRDETDNARQGNFSNWEKVIEHCSMESFSDIFSTNDYVIIHIDTDVGKEKNFSVPITKDGVDLSVEELIEKVIDFLKSKIDPDTYNRHGHKIIFAIAVHSIDCWLLPLYCQKKIDYSRTKNCAHHLMRNLEKKDLAFEKNYRCYSSLSRPYEKRKNIETHRKKNASLDFFLNSLPDEHQTTGPTVE